MTKENKTEGKTLTDSVGVTETPATNKCKYCNKVIGDFVSNYHVDCYLRNQAIKDAIIVQQEIVAKLNTKTKPTMDDLEEWELLLRGITRLKETK